MANAAEIAWLEWLRLDDEAQQRWYQIYRDYYEGVQGVPLSTRQELYLAQQMVAVNSAGLVTAVEPDSGFRFNYMALPINVMVQRLLVDGFKTSDITEGESSEDTQASIFQDWWTINRMDAVSIGVHRAAAIDGDTYILVSWNDEEDRPVFTHERAWAPFRDAQGVLQDAEGMKVIYSGDSLRTIEFAAKRWRTINVDDRKDVEWRLNLYFPDRIEKYKKTGDIVDDSTWGTPFEVEKWLTKDNKPLGVPVIPFRHDDDGSEWGRSKLDDLISVQNAINKTILDLMETSDLTAFPVLTLSGGDAKDQKGNAVSVSPGDILSTQDINARWGQIQSGDLTQLIKLKNELLFAGGQISQTPISYYQITGQVSSAEGQKASESNLVAAVELESVSFGNSWEDVMATGRKQNNRFGKGNMEESVSISTQWKPFERIDVATSEQQNAQTSSTMFATFQAATVDGFDTEQAALLAGYDAKTAAAMAKSKADATALIAQGGQQSTASNLVTDKGLTGIAGKTVIETLQQLAAGEITKTTAVEIIVGFGFDRTIAENLADAEIDNAKAAAVAEVVSGVDDVEIVEQ